VPSSRAAKPSVPFGGWDRRLVCDQPFAPHLQFAEGTKPKLPHADPWKLSSQLKQMSTLRECSRGGKRIDPRPQKRKISKRISLNIGEQGAFSQ